jgi:hypothetical protein
LGKEKSMKSSWKRVGRLRAAWRAALQLSGCFFVADDGERVAPTGHIDGALDHRRTTAVASTCTTSAWTAWSWLSTTSPAAEVDEVEPFCESFVGLVDLFEAATSRT